MPDTPGTALQSIAGLAARATRIAVAEDLARAMGGDALLVLVRDPAVEALVPAPGFARTLRGGSSWRELVRRLRTPGRHAVDVEIPPSCVRPATAVSTGDMAVVLLGTSAPGRAFEDLVTAMPLLGALFRAEQDVLIAQAQAKQADVAARRTGELVRALEAARAEAWRLNAELTSQHRQRDDFLAMLAHELRNPLAPLVTALAVLRRGGSAVIGSQVEIMDRQLRQLSRMVDDLLDVSRVRHGKIALRFEPVAVREVLHGAIDATRPLLDARGHALDVRLPETPLTIDGDAVRLTQVFSNLLHNAAKYTDPGGHLRVNVAPEGEQVVISIEDDGVGIDRDVLPHVFDLFVQAPVALDRAHGGLGIGLTLVRSLVELHGGTVRAASAGHGRGSRFDVSLPLHRTPASGPAPREAGTVEPARSLRILIVDDNSDLTTSVAMLLRMTGHKVDVAHSGWHALQLAADVDLDVVLLDIGLPDLDGYEAGRRLRRIIRKEAALVAMTGYGSEDDRRRSAEAGFDEHLVKPVEPARLESLLAEASRRRTGSGERVDLV